jgi:hypothetical protein
MKKPKTHWYKVSGCPSSLFLRLKMAKMMKMKMKGLPRLSGMQFSVVGRDRHAALRLKMQNPQPKKIILELPTTTINIEEPWLLCFVEYVYLCVRFTI